MVPVLPRGVKTSKTEGNALAIDPGWCIVPSFMVDNYHFPATRCGLTRKFNCGIDVYLTVNPKPDGEPGEVFVKCGKEGTTVSGLVQAWVVAISTALKCGVTWDELRQQFVGMRFDPQSPEYSSIVDAVARNIDELRGELRELVQQQSGQQSLDFTNGE